MKIVFTGTSDFAADILADLLLHKINITQVISQPDRPKGRKLILTPSPVSQIAMAHNLPLFRPENISSSSFAESLKSLNADLMIVIAYGQILKESVLTMFSKGCINVHASLLPKYRGAAPIQRAIIDGELETGITTMFMNKGLDSGDIILKDTLAIDPNDTYGSLHDKLLELGKQMLIKTINQLELNSFKAIAQDPLAATYAKKITKSDCLINWNLSAIKIHNLIRGLSPLPGAFAPVYLKGKFMDLKIWETEVIKDTLSLVAGTLLSYNKDAIIVKTNSDALSLKTVQLPGKNKLSAKQFLSGYSLQADSFLGH